MSDQDKTPAAAGTAPRQGASPRLVLTVGAAAVAAVLAMRWALTGRVWHAPADPMVLNLARAPGIIGLDGLMASCMVGAGVGIAGIVGLVRAGRGQAMRGRWAVCGLGLLALSVAPFLGMHSIFSRGATENIVARSEPLIVAIEQFKSDHDEYPAALADLVPRYLPAIPDTGYGPKRQFHYFRAHSPPGEGKGWNTWANASWDIWVGEATYALVVEQAPYGTLVYRPTGEYADLPQGTRIPGTRWGHTGAD